MHNGFSNKCQTDVIYTDFSKAFDTVAHELLIYKLDSMGFPTILLSWILTYLQKRTQKVSFKDILSNNINVNSGVPQGSHLGPLLFVLYLNDLPSVIRRSKILMFADDVKLYSNLESYNQLNNLQCDLNCLVNWCSENGMSLNLKKCKKLSFYRSQPVKSDYFIGSYKLDNVDSFVDLGVILDRKLSFNLHIDSCVNKAKSLLGFIKRWSKEFDDPYVTKRLFISLVRPTLEYGCVLWSPFYKLYSDKIESVQIQFLLFALRGLGWNSNEALPPYENRLKLIDLPSLHKRRQMLRCIFIIKLLRGQIQSEFLLSEINFNVPSRSTRNYLPLKLTIAKSNYELCNPLRSLCDEYNKLYNIMSLSEPLHVIKKSILCS